MFENRKLFLLEDVIRLRQQVVAQKFVLTNGCFDLLHAGHVYSLQQAAQFGQLWVALNSDKSIRTLKGPTRPVISEQERAYMLSALDAVAGIFIFDGPRLTEELGKIRPDIYVKSSDYTWETLNPEEQAMLKQIRTEVRFASSIQGISTTKLIEKIANFHSL